MKYAKDYNKEFASRLRYFLDRDNMTQQELAARLGVSAQAVTNWVQAVKTPRMDKIDAMCSIFRCERSDFQSPQERSPKNSLPLYGSVSAGAGVFANDRIEEWIDIGGRYSKEDHFMLRVRGDSMEPELHEGDYVVVKKQEVANDNDLVVAIVNGDEGFCKKFKLYGSGIALISINPRYEPLYFSAKDAEQIPVRVVGKVVESRRVYQ